MTEETDRERSEAYVTLATNDSYSVGALVLGQSLRNTGTRRQLIIMVTNQVTNQMREQLRETFDSLVVVDVLDSRDVANLNLLQRPDLGLTFTKLHCWRLTQFSKCVFLDADTLVLHNIDELFDCEELAAAPDVGWPDCFNSGVFVYRPSQETYSALINLALTRGSFDGGDQGLLNQYFSDWSTQGRTRRLPFIYNTVAQAFYSYSPAYKQYGHNVKVIHFVGSVKPWNVGYNTATRTLEGGPYQSTEFLQHWWNLFMDKVHHRLSDNLKSTLGSVGSPGHHVVGGEAWFPGNYTQQQLSDGHRQYDWERGQIDYMGMDSFDNIMRQIDTKIQPTAAPLVAASGVTGAPLASAGAPGYSGTNGPTVGPPGPKSRVLQALENQFREGSEFRKSSTESVSPVPPRKSVHRATVMLSPKVYREQVINKAAAAVSKTTSVKQPAGATAKPVVEKQPAAAVQQPVAGVQHPAAAVQQPVAGVQHPAAAVHQPIADVQQPAATVQQPITSVQQPRAAVQSPASSISTSPASPAAQGYGIASPNGTPSHLGAAFVQSPVGVQSPPVGGDVGGAYVQVQAQSGLPTQDDSGFVGYSADTTFGSGGSPLAFSTPAPGGAHFPHTGQHGHQQYGAKISPSSPPALPVDPFSVEASLTPDYPSAFAASDPFQAPGSFDPFAQGPKPGLGVSVHGSMPTGEATAHGPGTVHQTPTHGGAEVQFESHSGDQHHRAKRGGKRSKK